MAGVQDTGGATRSHGAASGAAADRITHMARSSDAEIDRMKQALSQLDAKLHAVNPKLAGRSARKPARRAG